MRSIFRGPQWLTTCVAAVVVMAAAGAQAAPITLAWDSNSDAMPVTGYRVYVGVAPGVYTSVLDAGDTTAFTYLDAAPGQQYYFAISAYNDVGEGAKSAEVIGFSDRPPVFTEFGDQATVAGTSVQFTLSGSDPDGRPVSYSATGLPAGLILTQSTGLISGTPNQAGSYTVTAMVNDGVLSASRTFTWTITAAPSSTQTLEPTSSAERVNVAAATSGAIARASGYYGGGYEPAAAINGDRKGTGYGAGGVWMDNTASTFPDWLEVDFSDIKTIDEIDVFSFQDQYTNPIDPTPTLRFASYGLVAFDVEYWDGSTWVTVPEGSVKSNAYVWRKFTFTPLSTSKIRVLVNAAYKFSRIAEIEAYEVAPPAVVAEVAPPPPAPLPTLERVNVAAEVNGGIARASGYYGRGFEPTAAINGDRKGTGYGAGGVWMDDTASTFPDWLEVEFSDVRRIDEIDVFSFQDQYSNPSEPTPTLEFASYGLVAFDVQYWDGTAWVTVPGGSVTGNSLVWRTVTFAPVSTSKIRVVVNSAYKWSRIAEVEAYTSVQ